MLWIILTIVAFITTYMLSKDIGEWSTTSKRKRSLIIINAFVAIGLLAFTITDRISAAKKEKANAVSDQLHSDIVTFPRVYIKYTNVFFSNDNGEIYWNEEDAHGNFASHLFALQVVNGKMVVSFNIRDTYGNVIASVYNNFWKFYRPTEYDYNYDDNAFEVITADHKVVCQLEYKDSAAYFIGFVGLEKGGAFWAMPKEMNSKAVTIIVGKGMDLSPYETPIPLLFKYPREQYVGERAK